MANGMASLLVGASGLKTAQTAINTTAHNLANINTEGYTRQQIAFQDTQYVKYGNGLNTVNSSTYGLGVGVSEIRRIRDQFIDSAYRTENSRLGYYSNQYNAIAEIEDLFGEMQGVTYQDSLNNFREAINELSKEPASTVARSAVIQTASAFMTRSDAVYQGLKAYQQTLNVDVQNAIKRINEIGNEIYKLNKRIAKIEATELESANDLRDQRDTLLDELSEYVSISYYEVDNGELMVTAETIPFVTITAVTEMSYRVTEGTDLMIPTWPAYSRDAYPPYEAYTNISDNDKGGLKGLILARGNVYTDYSDVPVKPLQKDYDLTTEAGRAEYEMDYAIYLEKQDYYNKYIEPSAILSAIAGVDKLVNGVVETLNDVLCPEQEIVTNAAMYDDNGKKLLANEYRYTVGQDVLYDVNGRAIKGYDNGDGTYTYKYDEELYVDEDARIEAEPEQYIYSFLDMEATDYGMDDAKTVGTELFSRAYTQRYVEVDGQLIRNNANSKGDRSEYKLGNLGINSTAAQDIAKIPLHTEQGKEDMSRGQALLDAWDGDFASVNPEQYAVGNFDEFYNNFVSDFATVGSVLENYVNNQTTMVDGYNDQRLQTEGVASDEELSKMIKYQQAYNASSRYINVISEMLEHLVTSLGS